MYIIDTIIPFDMIIDIEIGLIKLIKSNYRSRNVFNLDMIDNIKDSELKTLLKNRDIENPLDIISNIDDIQEINNIYKQFIDIEYKNIVHLSPKTSLLNLCNKSYYTQSIKIDIYCKNKIEKELINNIDENLKTVDECDYNKYSNIYIKNLNNLKDYNNYNGKNFYIANYSYNTQNDLNDNNIKIPRLDIISNLENNQFYLIDLYSFDQYENMVG